jgi:hypothetical protein
MDGTSIEIDTGYVKTDLDLAAFRAMLVLRSTFNNPPGPPYSHCP